MKNKPNVGERWRKIEKELEYVATYANPERRAELLSFLKGQFQELASAQLEEVGIDVQLMATKVDYFKDELVTNHPEYDRVIIEVKALLQSKRVKEKS